MPLQICGILAANTTILAYCQKIYRRQRWEHLFSISQAQTNRSLNAAKEKQGNPHLCQMPDLTAKLPQQQLKNELAA